jgi:hypothetical protein
MTPEQHKTVLEVLRLAAPYFTHNPAFNQAIAIMEADVPEVDCGNMPSDEELMRQALDAMLGAYCVDTDMIESIAVLRERLGGI